MNTKSKFPAISPFISQTALKNPMLKNYVDIQSLLFATKLDGLYGNGASEKFIHECEKKMNVSFPYSYKEFLREYGWGSFGPIEICGLGDDIPDEWKRGINILYIQEDEKQGPLRIPEKVIPFHPNGAGDLYALDCRKSNQDESPVIFISHEEAALVGFNYSICANSFADWVFEKLSIE